MTMYGATTFDDSYLTGTEASPQLRRRKHLKVISIDQALDESSFKKELLPLYFFNYLMLILSFLFSAEVVLAVFNRAHFNGFVSLSALVASLGLYKVSSAVKHDVIRNATND